MYEREQPPPSWFEEEPTLAPGEEFFLKSFWDLSTERQIGWASGPIPHSRIRDYGERKGLESSTMELFIEIIRSMDAAYLEWLASERKRMSNQSAEKPK